jgi:signal transduction histidine kinase
MTQGKSGIPLRLWFVVPFVLQVCLAAAMTGALSWRNGQLAVQSLASKLQSEIGARVQLKVEQYVEVPRQIVEANANAVKLGQLDITDLRNAPPHLLAQLNQHPMVSGLLVANEQGQFRAVNRRSGHHLLSADRPGIVEDLLITANGKPYPGPEAQPERSLRPDSRQTPWYRSAAEAGKRTWTPIFQTPERNRPDLSLNISQPVYGTDGKLQGVFSAGVVLSWLSDALKQIQVTPNSQIFITDRQGQLIASSGKEPTIVKEAGPETGSQPGPKLKQIRAVDSRNPTLQLSARAIADRFPQGLGQGADQRAEQFQVKHQGTTYFVHGLACCDNQGLDWQIWVVIPEGDLMAQINRNNQLTLLWSLAALALSIGLGLWLSQMLAKPIRELSHASRRLAAGDRDLRLNPDQPIRELGIVSLAFNQMTQQMGRSFNQLEHQVQDRTAQLKQAFDFEATLKQITDSVRDSLDEEQIIQTAVEALSQALPVKSCNAALYDLEAGTSTIGYESLSRPEGRAGDVLQLNHFSGYRQLLAGQSLQCCGLTEMPSRGRVALLACPMLDKSLAIGDLWLVKPAKESFSAQEIRLVQQVADQCAIALRQARLYSSAQVQVSELARLNQLKDDFLSTISHELRTPIANIQMSIELLEINLKRLGIFDGNPGSVPQYLEILKKECRREGKLINNLLDFSRLDGDIEPIKISSAEPDAWLAQIVEPFLVQSYGRHQFQLSLPSGLPRVETDLDHLERVITELLTNAYKYTPQGEKIAVGVASHATRLRFIVSNSGVEIEPEEQQRIFQQFYRIPNSDRWKYGGIGLGLALAKKFTEGLGGQIWVESGHNATTFIVEVPLEPPEPIDA